MGAKPSKRGLTQNRREAQPAFKRQRNYVQLCSPPAYNLFYDTTDSEITELEEGFVEPVRGSRKASLPPQAPPPYSFKRESVLVPPPPPPADFEPDEIPDGTCKSKPPYLHPRSCPGVNTSPSASSASSGTLPPLPPSPPLSPISELPSTKVSTLASATSISTGYLRTSRSLIQPRQSCSSPACQNKSLRCKQTSGSNICARQKCEARVMPDYQRYSREQPEREAAANPSRDCCRPTCSKNNYKHAEREREREREPTPPRNTSKTTHPPAIAAHRSSSRAAAHSPSRSRHTNSAAPQRVSSRRAIPQPTSEPSKSQRQSASSPNRYPHYPERPHIPLPPRCNRNTCTAGDECKSKRKQHYHDREATPNAEMYSHNTKRNFATKKPYSPCNTARANSPYDGPGPGCHETNCAHHEQCPMHRTCKCKCRCSDDPCCQGHGNGGGHHGHPRQPSPSPPRNPCRGQCQDHDGHATDEECSYYSDSSNSDLNLAYQRTGDYPELMDELENTLSYRNRLRVQKTMQRFEMLSRQNKSLEKPIFEDEDSVRHYKPQEGGGGGGVGGGVGGGGAACDCNCRACEKRRQCGMNNCPTRNEPPSFPRSSGYVEKVARYMDPMNGSDTSKGSATRKTSDGCSWQLDPRKNEWVKVDPNQQHQHHHHHHHHNNNHHHQGGDQPQHQDRYDFDSNYPPLPPRPPRGYTSGGGSNSDGGACTCAKCCRHPR